MIPPEVPIDKKAYAQSIIDLAVLGYATDAHHCNIHKYAHGQWPNSLLGTAGASKLSAIRSLEQYKQTERQIRANDREQAQEFCSPAMRLHRIFSVQRAINNHLNSPVNGKSVELLITTKTDYFSKVVVRGNLKSVVISIPSSYFFGDTEKFVLKYDNDRHIIYKSPGEVVYNSMSVHPNAYGHKTPILTLKEYEEKKKDHQEFKTRWVNHLRALRASSAEK